MTIDNCLNYFYFSLFFPANHLRNLPGILKYKFQLTPSWTDGADLAFLPLFGWFQGVFLSLGSGPASDVCLLSYTSACSRTAFHWRSVCAASCLEYFRFSCSKDGVGFMGDELGGKMMIMSDKSGTLFRTVHVWYKSKRESWRSKKVSPTSLV